MTAAPKSDQTTKAGKEPLPPTQLGFRYWLGQLWGVVRKALIVSFAGLGLVLLIKFGGKATVIILPVLVLLFGTGLYAWLRLKMRKKK